MRIIISLYLLFVISTKLYAQDGEYIRAGIIPYQLLSRSSGLYVGYDFNKFRIEYRPTYTLSTGLYPLYLHVKRDWFFYQGINNNALVLFNGYENLKLGVLIGYKYWWYNNQLIAIDEDAIFIHDNTDYENKSSNIKGACVGFEMNWEQSNSFFDKSFFLDIVFSSYSGNTTINYVQDYPSKKIISNQPYNRKYSQNTITLALGFKLGLRKPRKIKNQI